MKRYISAAVQKVSDLSDDALLEYAYDDNTPDYFLKEMAETVLDANVLAYVTFNRNVTPEIIDIILDRCSSLFDSDEVICAVVKSPYSNSRQIDKAVDIILAKPLKSYAMDDALYDASANHKTSLRTLQKLADFSKAHSYPIVLAAIVHNPNATGELILSVLKGDNHLARNVLERPDISTDFIDTLSDSSDAYVRSVVAKSDKTPSFILEKLAQDEHYYVRHCVANNSHTPMSVLRTLVDDDDSFVRSAARTSLEIRGANR